MKLRFPLYAKIILWFFLNLLALAVAFYIVFQFQFRAGMDSLLMAQASERIQSLSAVIASELNGIPKSGWIDVLKRFDKAYPVQFYLFGGDGGQVAGGTIHLPAEILAKIADRVGPLLGRGPPPGRGPPAGRGFGRRLGFAAPEPHPKFMLHTDDPSRYWIGVPLSLTELDQGQPEWVTLLVMSKSISGGGLFVDLTPWIVVGFAVLIFSLLFWFPFVRSITRSISQMAQATEQIAEGRFHTRVQAKRRDELGRLAQAINRMTERLSGFVNGQKRFLGDIAHELCSPIARIQVGLGILEQRTDEKQKTYVEDVREEVQQMSHLVNELLSFSKAGLQPKEIQLGPVNLAATVRKVLDRESAGAKSVEVRIEDSLSVQAEPELLTRALANLVRNAFRYAGAAGTISIFAVLHGDQITVTVADTGPGVPDDALEHIFAPFFRVESSRSRDTGGAGLGLAIVKTCVEACQGTVSAQNRPPSGLQVDIILKGGVE